MQRRLREFRQLVWRDCGTGVDVSIMVRLLPRILLRILPGVYTALTVACSGTWGGPTDRTTWHRHAITASYVAAATLSVCDSAGTIWMSHGGRYDRASLTPGHEGWALAESNPLLGREPPRVLIGLAALGAAAGGWALLTADSVPAWIKGIVFGGWIAVEGAVNVANNQHGTGVCGVIGTRSAGFVEREAVRK